MQVRLSVDPASGACIVQVIGAVALEDATRTLDELWASQAYGQADKAIYDLSRSTALPGFNDLFRLARFAGERRQGRGPGWIAFVSPDITGTVATAVFEGFDRAVGFRLRFFSSMARASEWLQEAPTQA